MNTGDLDRLIIQHLVAHVPCIVCGEHYTEADIKLLRRERAARMMVVFCHQCGTFGLVAAVMEEERVTAALDGEEAPKPEYPPLSADELLDLHEFLRDFQGDCLELLKR